MTVKDDLDILLITYNRKEKLKNMLSCIFADNSPIKKCSITFLDNCSTDGTSEMLSEYAQKYSNVTHIRHKHNIGGNANIVRALETVDTSKKYFWILCDDDYLDWTHWNKIEKALESESYDIINMYSNITLPTGDSPKMATARLIIDATFLPSCIYKTKWINSQVLINAFFNIHALFPHAALFMNIINHRGKIYRAPFNELIVTMIYYPGHGSEFIRGMDTHKHPGISDLNWQIGFSVSLGMLQDETLKQECVELMAAFEGKTYEAFLSWYVPYAVRAQKWNTISHLYEVSNNLQREKIYELIYSVRMWQDLENKKATALSQNSSKTAILGVKGALKYTLTGLSLLLRALKVKFWNRGK